MKKIFSLILLSVLLLLSACGQNGDIPADGVDEVDESVVEPVESSAPTVEPASAPDPQPGEDPEESGSEARAEQQSTLEESADAQQQSSQAVPEPQASTDAAEPPQSSTAPTDGAGTEQERVEAFMRESFPDFPVIKVDVSIGPRYTRIKVEVENADEMDLKRINEALQSGFSGELINNGTILDEIDVICGDISWFMVID